MKRFRIELHCTKTFWKTVEVEAETEDEATEKAHADALEEDRTDWDEGDDSIGFGVVEELP